IDQAQKSAPPELISAPVSFHGARKQEGGGPHPAPVDAQSLQQLGAQRNLAVAAALALVNPNHHALTVDVLYLQPAEFSSASCAKLSAGRLGQSLAHTLHQSSRGIDQLGPYRHQGIASP